ncbi:MAG: hypothetical protein QXY26_10025 [Ignisphaera sp.]
MSKILKTLSTYILIALVIISIIPLTLATPVKAQGEIKLTSDYLNPYKVIKAEVVGDFGAKILVELYNADTGEKLYEESVPSVGARTYRFYLAGPNANVVVGEPVISIPNGVGRGTTLRLVVVGTGLERVIYYTTVRPIVTLDRSEYPYRRDAVIVISYTDPDLDYNPDARDTVDPSNINVDIVVIKATGETKNTSTTLGGLGASSATEKTVTGGSFEFKIWLSSISSAVGVDIEKDDRVILSFATHKNAQGGEGWDDDKTSVSFRAVYRYPSVKVEFNYQKLTIEIVSPDDNVDSTARDHLDPRATISISGFASASISASAFIETGPNTGVFVWSADVEWGASASIDVAKRKVVLPVGTDGPFRITARYYYLAPRPGYSIDASGSGEYSPTRASLTIVKSTVKSIEVEVTKPDLNNRADSIEYFVAAQLTSGKFDIGLNIPNTNTRVARIQIKDKDGKVVNTKQCFSPSNVSMAEIDFNAGKFMLKIAAGCIDLKAGETYTLVYEDLAGFASGKAVLEIKFTIMPIAIKLDRDVYPARGTIVVHITYENDELNVDATKRDSYTVSWRAIYWNGTAFAGSSVSLTETGVDTGVFTGSFPIPLPATDAVIGGKIIVFDPRREEAKAEAEFRLRDGKISVSITAIGMGESFKVTVEDPDANLNSRSKDSITITLISKCGTVSKTLTETAENSGVFEATFTWAADRDACPAVAAPDTIVVEYTDYREIKLIEGYRSYPVTLRTSVAVRSRTGVLEVITAEPGYVALLEKFAIRVVDQDLNKRVGAKDEAEIYISLPGRIMPSVVRLIETAASSGIFSGEFTLGNLLGVTEIQELAQYVGKQIVVMYRDDADATGSINVVQQILTIRAYDPYIETYPKDFINFGEKLVITVTDKNIAGWKTIYVSVRSTTYPVPQQIPLTEVSPGVFRGEITVVKPEDWIMGAPQIPARLGDTVEVIYEAIVTSTGKGAIMTKSVIVGRYLEIPGKIESVTFTDEAGAPVTPRVGKATFINVQVSNKDIIERTMTVIIVVRDPNGVAVSIQFQVLTLRSGESRTIGFGWIPGVAGKHSVEVYAIKSLSDITPLAEPYTASVTVS